MGRRSATPKDGEEVQETFRIMKFRPAYLDGDWNETTRIRTAEKLDLIAADVDEDILGERYLVVRLSVFVSQINPYRIRIVKIPC